VTPDRTFGDRGSYRFDEVIPGVGRLRMKSGAKSLRHHWQRVALIRKLRDQGRLDLLKALKSRTITVLELLDADRRNDLPRLVADVYGARPLWPTVWETLDAVTRSPATVETYRKSWRALEAAGILRSDAKVSDLARVDWNRLEAAWGRSPASWNQLRRAVSRVLTLLLGAREHPLRVGILKGFPDRQEIPRMPELSPADFRRALEAMDAPLQGPILLMAMTGMRLGEYKRLTPAHLGTYSIRVPGTKSEAAPRTLPVAPELWGWVTAAVPCPVSSDLLRVRWYAALDRVDLPRIRLHDLRHCTAQWLHDAGRPLSSIMQTLGHSSLAQTEQYAKRRLRQDDALAMATLLAIPHLDTQQRRSGERKPGRVKRA
jgi:integrase